MLHNDGWWRRDDSWICESDTKNVQEALMLPAWHAPEHLWASLLNSAGDREKWWKGELFCEENDLMQLSPKPEFAHFVLLKINETRKRSVVHTKFLCTVCTFGREIRSYWVKETLFSLFFNCIPIHRLWSVTESGILAHRKVVFCQRGQL